MLRKLIFLLCLVLPHKTWAQFYESGQDPASIHWKQINTDRFKLIYPDYFSEPAKQFAAFLDRYKDTIPGSLHHTPRKIPILFHAQSSESNGFVVWAPKRMELYTLPAQDEYGQDWLKQLALHEYRHVVQVDKLNQGFTHVGYFLGGEQVVGLVSGLLPRWFLEGDAVHSETSFSATGRGRMPSFDMELRTLWLSRKKPYPFNKMLRGSYRDYVPDIYQSGYRMTAWLRDTCGPDVFDKAISNTFRRPFTLHPFYASLKKQTGLKKQQIYRHTFNDLKKNWLKQVPDRSEPKGTRQLNTASKNAYTNYRFPQYLNDSLLVAEKTGIGLVPRFVLISIGKTEKNICQTGYTSMVNLSVSDGNLIWSENIPDPRWQNAGKTLIRIRNYAEKKTHTITRSFNWSAPCLSPDAKAFVAVENTPDYKTFLVFGTTGNKEAVTRIPGPSGEFIQQPRWIDAHTVAAILLDERGKRISLLDVQSGKWTDLFPPVYDELSDNAGNKDWVFFRAGFSGLSQIYAIRRNTLQCWQVTADPFGAYYPAPSPDGTKLAYSAYSVSGFNLKETPLDTTGWIPFRQVERINVSLYDRVSAAEGHPLEEKTFSEPNFTEKKYGKAAHLFRLHSWLPFYADYNSIQLTDPQVFPGFTLLSQNTLGTALSSVSFADKGNSRYLESRFTYKGWYPVIELSHTMGGNNYYYPSDSAPDSHAVRQVISLNSYLPLNLSRGGMIRFITPLVSIDQRSDRFLYSGTYKPGIAYVSYRLVAYQYLRTSSQDIAPRFGQVLDLNLKHTPFENSYLGSIGSLKAGLYLPGILRHQSLYLLYTRQKQWVGGNKYFYTSLESMPRGYFTLNALELKKWSASYYFPLWYPDLNLGTAFYLKRIRGSFFAEVAGISGFREMGKWISDTRRYSSEGMELLADFHLFQLMFPFTAGVQAIYLHEMKSWTIAPSFYLNLTAF